MSNEKTQRKSFRMLDTVHLLYEVIDDAVFHQGVERWKLRSGSGAGFRTTLLDIDARFREKLLVLQSHSSVFAEALILLNSKINAAIDELPDLRKAKSVLAQETPRTCEIGADGMLFAADQEYPPGTKMALRLLLAADSRYIETFCNVVRNTDTPDDSDPNFPCGIAVEFSGMSSVQKDVIVQHLFDRESETLRMRRLDIESHQ